MLQRPLVFVLVLFLAAFVVRLGLVVLLRDLGQGPVGSKSADDVQFEVLARNLAEGNGYRNADGRPTSFRAPGWPIFLAGVYCLAGTRPWVVYLVCCALGAASCALAYGLGRELLDEKGARLAGLLGAFYLPSAWFATQYCSENLFLPLLPLAAWLLVRSLRNGSLLLAGLAGLVLGWMVLTRPFALLVLPLWGLVLLRARGWGGLVPGAFLVLGCALVVGPWVGRNYSVHHRLVLVATNGGSTFYGGNNDRVVRQYRLWGSWVSTTELPHRDRIESTPDEVSRDQVEWDLGKTWVREHPAELVLIEGLKLARLVFWLPEFDGGRPSYYAIRALGYLPFVPFLLLGAFRLLRGPERLAPPWWVIHASLLATVLTALVFWGSPRFRDANAPLLGLYAAVGLRGRRIRPAEPENTSKMADSLRSDLPRVL